MACISVFQIHFRVKYFKPTKLHQFCLISAALLATGHATTLTPTSYSWSMLTILGRQWYCERMLQKICKLIKFYHHISIAIFWSHGTLIWVLVHSHAVVDVCSTQTNCLLLLKANSTVHFSCKQQSKYIVSVSILWVSFCIQNSTGFVRFWLTAAFFENYRRLKVISSAILMATRTSLKSVIVF